MNCPERLDIMTHRSNCKVRIGLKLRETLIWYLNVESPAIIYFSIEWFVTGTLCYSHTYLSNSSVWRHVKAGNHDGEACSVGDAGLTDSRYLWLGRK